MEQLLLNPRVRDIVIEALGESLVTMESLDDMRLILDYMFAILPGYQIDDAVWQGCIWDFEGRDRRRLLVECGGITNLLQPLEDHSFTPLQWLLRPSGEVLFNMVEILAPMGLDLTSTYRFILYVVDTNGFVRDKPVELTIPCFLVSGHCAPGHYRAAKYVMYKGGGDPQHVLYQLEGYLERRIEQVDLRDEDVEWIAATDRMRRWLQHHRKLLAILTPLDVQRLSGSAPRMTRDLVRQMFRTLIY